jgi:hypothetical protein
MATETMTMEGRQRKPKDANLPPENERFIRCCSDIASYLIQEFQNTDSSKPKKDLNLNSLRTWWDGKTSRSSIYSLSRRQQNVKEVETFEYTSTYSNYRRRTRSLEEDDPSAADCKANSICFRNCRGCKY